jgi:SAM-dependent methyltransferase
VCDLAKQSIPFEDDYFDLVIFTEVLEHVPAPPSQVLREVRRVIRKGGKLILSVPNIAALHCRLKLLFGVQPLSDPDLPIPHLHEYTMKEITSMLKACDLVILGRKYLRHSPTDAFRGFQEGSLLRSLSRVVYRGIAPLLMVPSFGDTIYLECSKPMEGSV